MTPKEKAKEYLNEISTTKYNSIGDAELWMYIEEAIDIALKEQRHNIFDEIEIMFLQNQRDLTELKEKHASKKQEG